MERPSPLIWLFLILLLILPTALGRFLLDLAGGILLAFFTIGIIIAGIGWIGWRKLNANMKTCEKCGLKSLSNTLQCPMCGSNFENNLSSNMYSSNSDASKTTIDIIAKDTE